MTRPIAETLKCFYKILEASCCGILVVRKRTYSLSEKCLIINNVVSALRYLFSYYCLHLLQLSFNYVGRTADSSLTEPQFKILSDLLISISHLLTAAVYCGGSFG